jgi:hypothetical protein
MSERLSPNYLDLIRDAALKSYWRKNALIDFLRRTGIAERTLSALRHEESKRTWLDRLFPLLEANIKGPAVLNRMAVALADQTSFPDLLGWEDEAQKIGAAERAVAALKTYMAKKKRAAEDERDEADRRKAGKECRTSVKRSIVELDALRDRFDKLCVQIGTQQAGYDFQPWFYDLMDYFDVTNRRPYVAEGRQIDGSVSIDGTTYLIELKFTGEQSGATNIDSLVAKVNSKADNTMGVMVSVSGYSTVAIAQASFAKSPLLLIEHGHLYYVLMGNATIQELVTRIRRHSAQEGKAYLPVNKFGG